MDIITHSLSGVAIGTVVANFKSGSKIKRLGYPLIGGIAGAFPDLDVISKWSRFDGTFGKIFHLNESGSKIYESHYWYSHHGFLHSIVAAVTLGLLLSLVVYFIRRKRGVSHKFPVALTITFVFAYICHLVEDMPTPSGAWGGVNFLWPTDSYTGGFGRVWWWNNYDIFLIVLSVVFVNSLLLILGKRINFKKWISLFVIAIGIIVGLYQINTRSYNFNYSGRDTYQRSEIQSQKIQKEILGETVYGWMVELDRRIPVGF